MIKVIGVRFRKAGKVYYFDPAQMEIKMGDHVIVETARGIEFGEVVLGVREVDEKKVIQPLKSVIRMATKNDEELERKNKEKEHEAFQICQEKIRKHDQGKGSDLEVQFKGLVADFYVKDQSAKVKAAVNTKRGRGEYCCGSAPYGYRINPENRKELLIVEDEVEVIRRVFELTNQRYSKTEICRLFNEEGILTPLQSMSKRQKSDNKKASTRGLQWTSDMIRKILNDKNYIGCMVYGKTKIPDPGTGKEVPVPKSAWKVIENHHEPIISRETFEKAQALQIRHTKKSKFDKETTLLSGYVKCGNCRRSLTGSKRLHGHVLYSCAYSQGKEDTGTSIRSLGITQSSKIRSQVELPRIPIFFSCLP